MNNIITLKNFLCAVFGCVCAAISNIFGGWTSAMTTLIIFMSLDYITGLIVAGVFKNSTKSESGGLCSIIGWRGLFKKGVTLLIVLVAHRLDMLIGTDYIKNAVIIAFCANELISLIENAGLMGIPIPSVITKAIEVLKEKGEEE